MIKYAITFSFIFNVLSASAACLSDTQSAELTKKESVYLSQKIPPAFKHALQAGQINIAIEPVASEPCQAKLVVILPQADIDAANKLLDAQVAKKIMLSAQGYVLPQEPKQEAVFNVDTSSLNIAHADVLQTAALGKLRASLELMYAFITQQGAEVTPSQKNTEPWPQNLRQQVVASCSAKQSEAMCTCMAEQYAQSIAPKQMEYIQYVRENPYAVATGANQGFDALKQQAEAACRG